MGTGGEWWGGEGCIIHLGRGGEGVKGVITRKPAQLCDTTTRQSFQHPSTLWKALSLYPHCLVPKYIHTIYIYRLHPSMHKDQQSLGLDHRVHILNGTFSRQWYSNLCEAFGLPQNDSFIWINSSLIWIIKRKNLPLLRKS